MGGAVGVNGWLSQHSGLRPQRRPVLLGIHEPELPEPDDAREEVSPSAVLEVVNIFLEHDGYGEAGAYLFADEIVRQLDMAGVPITKELLQRSVMPALRDAGVFVVSSEQGYKLPDCVADVDRHVVRTENQVRPRLARLRELRAGLLLGTENAFDAVADEQHEFVRTLLRATER